MKKGPNKHTHSESCTNFPETASVLKEKPSGKEIREFLEKHKLCADRKE